MPKLPRIKKVRVPSEKAKKQFRRILFETRKQNNFCKDQYEKNTLCNWIPDAWSWANTPICDNESLNMLLDMRALINSEVAQFFRAEKHGWDNYYTAFELRVVQDHINQRIDTYR